MVPAASDLTAGVDASPPKGCSKVFRKSQFGPQCGQVQLLQERYLRNGVSRLPIDSMREPMNRTIGRPATPSEFRYRANFFGA